MKKKFKNNQTDSQELSISKYDRKKLDPQFAQAESEGLWELAPLCNHYHPSVASWAKFVSEGSKIKYDGNSLIIVIAINCNCVNF